MQKNKILYILVGIPGSGKTYMAKHMLMRGTGWRYISRDEIRMECISDDEEYFSHEDEVFDIFVYKIRSALQNGDTFNVIADATHLNWPSRRKLLMALREDKINFENLYIIPVMINCSFEQAVLQNNSRTGRACVPYDVIKNMYYKLTDPKKDPFLYDGIMYIDNMIKR